MINIQNIESKLGRLSDPALKQYAEMHKDDPYTFSLALSESNRRKRIRSQAPEAEPQPKVVDKELADMDIRKALPEDLGIARLPADMRMAGGGIVAFSTGGEPKESPAPSFDSALDMEGIDDPQQRAFLKAIYSQESSSGKNTKTSNRGAQGGMQILPSTFKSVADKGMDINDPLDNMRAGIRYASQGYKEAGGDPVLAGAYYYGGPGGMKKASEGVAVSDPKNPKAPTTIGYGNSIAKKMFDFLPIGSAQAGEMPSAKPAPRNAASSAPQPEPETSDSGMAATAGTAAAGLGYYPAKAGLETLRDKIKAADAARVVHATPDRAGGFDRSEHHGQRCHRAIVARA